MNKSGFTLIELLAVIAVLGIIVAITATSINVVHDNALKKLRDEKIAQLENSAIIYGQENPNQLEKECEHNSEKYTFCKKVNAKFLIEEGYFQNTTPDSDGKINLINDYTKNSMLCDTFLIYRHNNRVYAKSINIQSNENNNCDAKVEFKDK